MVSTRSSWERLFNHRQIKTQKTMQRLSPEDLQAIVTGVATNRELITGIAAQLKDMIQTGMPGQQQSHQSTTTLPPLVTTQSDQQQTLTGSQQQSGPPHYQQDTKATNWGPSHCHRRQGHLPNSRTAIHKSYRYLCKVSGWKLPPIV